MVLRANEFPEDKRILGRWLGKAHRIGQAMCYWVLMATGKPIARSTVQPITEADMMTEAVNLELQSFNETISLKLTQDVVQSKDIDLPDYLGYFDNNILDKQYETPLYETIEPEAAMPEMDEFTLDDFDKYISVEVLLPKGDEMVLGKVIGRKRDIDDNPIGMANNNPILDARLYEVQFPEGVIEE
jgi:hypothetical protein